MKTKKNINKGSWITGLDSIRFVLALIVFLSHLGNPFKGPDYPASGPVIKLLGETWGVLFSGVGAVMAFFIISGFVIHYPYRDKFPETKSFLVRRWTRIALPLAVISVIGIVSHTFDLIPIWSLYCELIYYTLYPLLIRIRVSWGVKLAAAFFLSYLLILTKGGNELSSFVHRRNINYSGAYWQFGDLLTWIVGLPVWLLGVCLAEQIGSCMKDPSVPGTWAFRLAVLCTGIILEILKFHLFLSYVFTMNLFAVLLFYWLRNEILYYRRRQPVTLLEYSGKFSYSLYLCHNVSSYFITMVVPLTLYSYLPVVALTIFSAFLFYLVVERPSHLLSRKLALWTDGKRAAINY